MFWLHLACFCFCFIFLTEKLFSNFIPIFSNVKCNKFISYNVKYSLNSFGKVVFQILVMYCFHEMKSGILTGIFKILLKLYK